MENVQTQQEINGQEQEAGQFQRTEMLFGQTAMERLQHSKVAVFGIGGVGGYATEVLARSGVGELWLIDNDRVSLSNLNRQIIALHSTLGQLKVDAMATRIGDINPRCRVVKCPLFYLPENADEIDLSQFEYVVDAIDTVKAKLEIIRRCAQLGIPVISSMGAANKLDPSAFRVADISKTSMDPLARILRKKLRKEGITHFKTVCSEEQPLKGVSTTGDEAADSDTLTTLTEEQTKNVPASNAFVPAAAGLVLGGEVVRDLIRSVALQKD